VLLAVVLLVSGCTSADRTEVSHMGEMKISSPAFADMADMPMQFTCQGNDTSPRLDISDVPADARSLALIVDDPDAPMGTWVHWVVFDMDPATTVIVEGSPPAAGVQGKNSGGRNGYSGPCPPSGKHRYFFKLYALDKELGLGSLATKADIENAMTGHILETATLTGLYQKR